MLVPMTPGARRLASGALGVFRDGSAIVMVTVVPLWYPRKHENIYKTWTSSAFSHDTSCGNAKYRLLGAESQEIVAAVHLKKEKAKPPCLNLKSPTQSSAKRLKCLNTEFYYREMLGWRAGYLNFSVEQLRQTVV